VVTAAVVIRACEAYDLEHFEPLGGLHHARYCREQFARGPQVLAILVALGGDAPVGKVHLDFEERADRDEAVLLAAAVVPAQQGRGVGTQLKRLGYVATGEADLQYAGSPVPNPGVWMRKGLPC
jgi:GNAT superfamily N-acetyltransferase